jgi:hypothetical protein
MPNHRSVEAAIARVEAVVRRLDGEDVPLRTASGRLLAADIRGGHARRAGRTRFRDLTRSLARSNWISDHPRVARAQVTVRFGAAV